MTLDATAILDLLEQRHQPPEWSFLRELRCGTGYAFHDGGRKIRSEVESRLDAWAINNWSSRHRQRVTYEIKVSAADFQRELRNPLKRRPGLLLSNLFYFVAPEDVIFPGQIPDECGLLLVTERPIGLVLKEAVPAPWRDTPPPPWHFVAAICRRGERE